MDLVLVEWVDAVYHDLWEAIEDIQPTNMMVTSVGWIAKKTPHYLTIIPHRQEDQTRGGISIPCLAVKRIQKLAESDEEFTCHPY